MASNKSAAANEADEWLGEHGGTEESAEVQRAAQVVRTLLAEDEWLPIKDAVDGRIYEVWTGHAIHGFKVNGVWFRRDTSQRITPSHYREIRNDKPKGA